MYCGGMNEAQTKLQELQVKGWTVAALADELGIRDNTVRRWIWGVHQPEHPKLVIEKLDTLMKRKPPPRRRYPGTHHLQRKASGSDDGDD